MEFNVATGIFHPFATIAVIEVVVTVMVLVVPIVPVAAAMVAARVFHMHHYTRCEALAGTRNSSMCPT